MSLTVTDICHSFGAERVLDGVSLEANAGEIVCLFGPSGCGKTTLLRLIAGLERLQSGSVTLGGNILASATMHTPPERRQLGFVFQEFVLFPHLTVAKNIEFGLSDLGPESRAAKVDAELSAVNLSGFEGRYPHELSGGQQQRAALARAFARAPRAMLLDEPFASIDTALRRRLRAEMRRILKARAAPAIFVTHDPEEAVDLADRIAVMRNGRIVEAATPEELFKSPRSVEGAAIFPGAQIIECAAAGVDLTTPFGDIRTPSPPDARSVRAVIHVDGLRASPDPQGVATIVDCRFSGPEWMVTAESLTHPGKMVRISSLTPIAISERVAIRFDPERVRVFGA